MALSEQQYQDLIIVEVGDDAAGTLATVVPLYWERRSAYTDLEARYRYAKRDALDAMLGRVRGQVKIVGVGGASIDAHQLFTHLQDMRTQLQAEIDMLETSGGSGGAVGDLTTTAPSSPPTGMTDANHPAYRGDPYYYTRRRP